MRRICVWSGKRGGFGALVPTMDSIAQHPDLELLLVVTDQHLYDQFGKTVTEVENQFPIAARIDMAQGGDSNADRARAIGHCVEESVGVIQELVPDILLIIGDRGEVLAASIVAHNMRIAIAHIQGGDVSGSLDEPVRHAITKLAHIHFPATPTSADRIISMGEEPWRVHVVGDPHLDPILIGNMTPEAELRARYDLAADAPFLLVLQHSDSTVPDESGAQIKETVAAVTSFNLRTLFVYPCSDQGYEGIISQIEAAGAPPTITVHKNIPAPDFAGLQKIAACLVGNSSAGLIEAPYFGLPAINIGLRQIGREYCGNVIHVPYERTAIADAIRKALKDREFHLALQNLQPPFGDGRAFDRMTKVMLDVELDERLLNKRMTY
jgi:UDP-hydrolysing UDP-N-acetyl-D-glucosamine 2-epimerase